MHSLSHSLACQSTTPQLQGQIQGAFLFGITKKNKYVVGLVHEFFWFSNITLSPTQFGWHYLNAALTKLYF